MFARHITLTANVVSTVTEIGETTNLEVVNVDGAAAVYFTTDGSTPTVQGDDTYFLPAAVSGFDVPAEGSKVTAVKLISSGTPRVYVRAW